jgi:hypothetical protein
MAMSQHIFKPIAAGGFEARSRAAEINPDPKNGRFERVLR